MALAAEDEEQPGRPAGGSWCSHCSCGALRRIMLSGALYRGEACWLLFPGAVSVHHLPFFLPPPHTFPFTPHTPIFNPIHYIILNTNPLKKKKCGRLSHPYSRYPGLRPPLALMPPPDFSGRGSPGRGLPIVSNFGRRFLPFLFVSGLNCYH